MIAHRYSSLYAVEHTAIAHARALPLSTMRASRRAASSKYLWQHKYQA